MSKIEVKLSGIDHYYELISYDAAKKEIIIFEPKLDSWNNGNSWGYGGHNKLLARGEFTQYIKKMFDEDALWVNFRDYDILDMDAALANCDITYLS